jgi:DNA invertase Pin-like site-specific DNA recombinase
VNRAMRIVAYTRVSTEEQDVAGHSLDAQLERIRYECAARGWLLTGREVDTISTRARQRPALSRALDALAAGEYDGLVVARLDRLSRSVGHFAGLLERADKEGWQLVCLDPSVDTTSPYGRAMAQMAAVFAELERSLISQRTKEGLAAARAAGTFRPGEYGPKPSAEAVARILELWALGYSKRRITELVSAEGIERPRGGTNWDRKTVTSIIKKHEEARAA